MSERHLANLEYGIGNASILILLQVAHALQCSLAELIGDVTTRSPEWLLIRELLENRDEATLRRAREAIGELLDDEALRGSDLSRFHAIVVGIRAYNTRDVLRSQHDRLMQYVEGGGTVSMSGAKASGQPQAARASSRTRLTSASLM